MLGRFAIGAGKQEHPMRMMRERGPDLRAVDYKIAIPFDGMGLQRGKVRSRIGFRVSLAPQLGARQDIAQVTLFLRVSPPMNQGRSEQPDTGSRKRHSAAGQFKLLVADDFLQQRAAASAILLGPGY